MTVTGPVAPEQLGVVQTHEHLLSDARSGGPAYADFVLDDPELIVKELAAFREAGGGTLVEVTTRGLAGRRVDEILQISKRTGVKVILGTGYYTRPFYPPEVEQRTVDDLAAEMITDLTDGFGDSGIRAGVIGEIGTLVDAIHPLEEKVFQAAALAHKATGVPITTHTDSGALAMEQVELLTSLGVSPSRIIIGHLDNRIDLGLNHALARTGVYLEFDGIGQDYYSEVTRLQYPSDEERARAIADLVERGFLEQILLSSDICRKRHLKRFGGFGYDHILRRFIPLLRRHGFAQEEVETMLVANPARALSPAV
jgi:phosphotriesterase-related protein